MTPQEFLKSKGINVNEAVRTSDGKLFTVCELLKAYAEITSNKAIWLLKDVINKNYAGYELNPSTRDEIEGFLRTGNLL
jgi:hypothetical protein